MKIKIYTRDGRYFKFDKYDRDKQIGIVLNEDGSIKSQIYFYNDQITAIEEIY